MPSDEVRGLMPRLDLTDPIFVKIRKVIVAGRLPPGAKLGEDQLGAAFGVSRTRIRQSLQLLSAAGLVSLFPNRGAFVARPSEQDAVETYAARCLIECELVAQVAKRRDPAALRVLRAHLKQQRAAEVRGDRVAFVGLIGDFHRLLASVAGNRVLEQIVGQLVARTSLIISLYEHPGPSGCAVDEHEALIGRIAAGDARGSARLMARHLNAVRSRLRLDRSPGAPVDLRALFA